MECRADLFHAEGLFTYQLGDLSGAQRLFLHAQEIRVSLGKQDELSFAITADNLLNTAIELGDNAAVQDIAVEPMGHNSRRGQDPNLRKLLPDSWMNLGRCWDYLKEGDRALHAFEQAWNAFKAYGDPNDIKTAAIIKTGILAGQISTSDLHSARQTLGETVDLLFAVKDYSIEARIQVSLVEHATALLIRLGDSETAELLFQVAEEWRERIKKQYTPRALEFANELRQKIETLLGRPLQNREMAKKLSVDDVAGVLRRVSYGNDPTHI